MSLHYFLEGWKDSLDKEGHAHDSRGFFKDGQPQRHCSLNSNRNFYPDSKLHMMSNDVLGCFFWIFKWTFMRELFACCVWNGLDLLLRMRKWGTGWSLSYTGPTHESKQDLSNHASRLSLGESLGKICQYEQGKKEQKYKEVAEIGCMCSWETVPLEKSNAAQQRPALMITQSEFTVPIFPQHPV